MKYLLFAVYCFFGYTTMVSAQSTIKTFSVKDKKYDGFTYTGIASEDGPHGRGKAIYDDNDVYEGSFSLGKRHGNGLYKYANGDLYDGNWDGNKRHGYGEYTWAASGNTYKGLWADNLQDGKGKKILKDGSVQEGTYSKSKKHGNFIFTYPDGKKERRVYEMNKLVEGPVVLSGPPVAENKPEVVETKPPKPPATPKPAPKPVKQPSADEIWLEAMGSLKGSTSANRAIDQYGTPDKPNNGDEMLERRFNATIVPFHKKGARFYFNKGGSQYLKTVSFFETTGSENARYSDLLPFGLSLSDTQEDLKSKYGDITTVKKGNFFIDYNIKPDRINYPDITLKVVYVEGVDEPVRVELNYE